MSRATGVGMGAYAREVTFYQELADRIEEAVPGCAFAAIDGVRWLLHAAGGRPEERPPARGGC